MNKSLSIIYENVQNYVDYIIILSVLFTISIFSFSNYLLYHSLSELIALLMAFSIFIIFYNTRSINSNFPYGLLGIGYLFVGLFGFLHTLAYKGMGVFSGFSANLPTQLWIIARYFEIFIILQFIFFLGRNKLFNKSIKNNQIYIIIFIIDLALFIFFLLSIFVFFNFPIAYIEGSGLTIFKIYSEYLIIILSILAILLLYTKKEFLDKYMFKMMVSSIIFAIFAELCFTLYIDVYGFFNYLGHIFRAISIFLFYKGFISFNFINPYNSIFNDLVKESNTVKLQRNELNDFAHSMSHDLNNYISKIQLSINLRDSSDEILDYNKIKEMDNKIISFTHQMRSLLNHSVKLADLGLVAIKSDNIDLNMLVKMVKNSIITENIDVIISELPVIKCDAIKLTQVFKNLIENAIFHGKANKIEIYCKNSSIFVSNNGSIIPIEIRKKIFLKGFSTKSVEDSGGFGLNIVKKILDAHKWNITLEESEKTVFRIDF